MKRELWITAAGVMAVMAAMASIAATDLEQELIDRIKPVGEVCIQGKSDCAAPVAAVASGPRSGEQVYGAACVACHDSGLAGAPKIAVADDWAPRIAQGEDALVGNALSGIRGMPPKGTCMNCSDEEIKLAVEYMVSRSQ
ncbi:MAG: cytochrome c5 family protein [Gammaproteobacteria bacterium]|nr:cytochrome c5 family protein [Gammaproteobacteria bacterium]